jgi:hypothetical protein
MKTEEDIKRRIVLLESLKGLPQQAEREREIKALRWVLRSETDKNQLRKEENKT